jgi:hypothetical protein
MRTSRTLAATLILASFAASVAACGDDAETSTGDTTPDSSAPVDGAPGGAEGGLFVEVAYVGGFRMQGADFRDLPSAVVYEDGTVVAPGAVPAIYPGPAVLPMFTGQVDEGVLDDLLAAVGESGILEGTPDYGDMDDIGIADAASTRVTVVVDGEEHVVEAYALVEGGMGGTGMLADEQLAARESLLDLVTAVEQAASGAATDPLAPAAYRVLALAPIDPANLDPAGPAPGEQAWPEGLPEPVENECTLIDGDAVAPLEAALTTANELTQWTLGDRTFSLVVRGLLPHEGGCPEG